jgi:hypothetical protein
VQTKDFLMSETQEAQETETVELELEDSNYEVVDDADQDDDDQKASSGGEEELDKYSKQVQERINKLTFQRRQAEEEAAAAVQYIQQVQAQNEDMKRRLSNLDKGYMSEYEGRISSQEAQAKRALAEAYEAGDYDRVADAQQAISQIAIEKERLRVQKSRSQAAAAQQQQPQQQPLPQQQRQQQAPQRDPKLEAWLGKNDWFEKDKVMRSAARAIHETLVAEEGYDPTSDEYYAEIDKRMRREMPHKFQGDKKNVQSVTPAGSGNRSLKSGRKKQVELNPGQVRLAERLGVPLDKYAAQVAKLENRRD